MSWGPKYLVFGSRHMLSPVLKCCPLLSLAKPTAVLPLGLSFAVSALEAFSPPSQTLWCSLMSCRLPKWYSECALCCLSPQVTLSYLKISLKYTLLPKKCENMSSLNKIKHMKDVEQPMISSVFSTVFTFSAVTSTSSLEHILPVLFLCIYIDGYMYYFYTQMTVYFMYSSATFSFSLQYVLTFFPCQYLQMYRIP